MADAFNRADQLDAEAKALTQTDSTLAAAKSAEAQSIRQNAWLIATGKTGVEMIAERILPEERLLLGLGKGTVTGKLLNRFGKSGLEGLTAELGDQAINNRVYGDAIDAAALGKAAFMEAAVGSPLIVAGSLLPGSGHGGSATGSDGLPSQALSPAPHPLGERLQFSQGEAGKAMRDLAADGSRFRRNASSNDPAANGPASQSTDLAKIVSDYDLGGELDSIHAAVNYSTIPTLHNYQLVFNEGGEAYMYHGKNGTVWVDTTGMRARKNQPNQGGDLVYQAALTYAHNHGLRFIPDPHGVKPIAKSRRISHMLSSALRHGTTRHIQAEGRNPLTGKAYQEVTKWHQEKTQADFEHNVEQLALTEMQIVEREMNARGEVRLKDLKWNPEDDTITHEPTGSRLSRVSFNEIVSRLDPGRSGVGPTTLSRALVSQAALQGSVPTSNSIDNPNVAQRDERGGAPDSSGRDVFRMLSRRPYLFYSQPDGAGNATLGSHLGDSHQLGQQIAETVGHLNQRVPGLLNERMQIFATTEDLLNSDYARSHSFTAEQRADIDTAEGFHDQATGKSVVIASNVVLRPGETPRAALTRVLLHESVGHGGLNAWLGTNKGHQARWDKLTRQIPQDQIEAIGAETGYRHLQTNRPALAFEWFARQAERGGIESIQKQPLLRELWESLKAAVQDLYLKVGMPLPSGKAFDLEVQSLLRQARKHGLAKTDRSGAYYKSNDGITSPDSVFDAAPLQFSSAVPGDSHKSPPQPRPYAEAISAAVRGKLPPNAVIDLGRPGTLLREAGLPDLPLRLRQRTVRKKTTKHPELTEEILVGVPDALNSPMAVYTSPDDSKSHAIVTTIPTNNGPITAYVIVRQDQRGENVLDTKTLFGKDPGEILSELRRAQTAGQVHYRNQSAFEAWLATQARGILSDTSHQHQQAIEGLNEFFAQES